MKKVLIIYYSWTGNNKEIAQLLRGELDCDIEKISEINTPRIGPLGYMVNGVKAALKMSVKIKEIKNNPGNYDLIVLVTPFWAGTLPPATRVFLLGNKKKLKRIALLSISGTGIANEKVMGEIENLLGKKLSASLLLNEEEFKDGKFKKKFNYFVREVGKK